jgi:hypothetical protein
MPRPASIPKLTHHKASGKAVVRLNAHDHYLGMFGTPEAEIAYMPTFYRNELFESTLKRFLITVIPPPGLCNAIAQPMINTFQGGELRYKSPYHLMYCWRHRQFNDN